MNEVLTGRSCLFERLLPSVPPGVALMTVAADTVESGVGAVLDRLETLVWLFSAVEAGSAVGLRLLVVVLSLDSACWKNLRVLPRNSRSS